MTPRPLAIVALTLLSSACDPTGPISEPFGELEAFVTDAAVALRWPQYKRHMSYAVQRRTTETTEFRDLERVESLTYQDATVVGGQSYVYRVAALSGGEPRAYSTTTEVVAGFPAGVSLPDVTFAGAEQRWQIESPRLSRLHWSRDDRRLTGFLASGQQAIVTAATGEVEATFFAGSFSDFLAWDHSGDALGFGGVNRVDVLAAIDGATVTTYTADFGFVEAGDWRSDDKQVVIAGGSRLYIWDVAAGEVVAILASHTQDVAAVRWSASGLLIASGDTSGRTIIWDATAWVPVTDFSLSDRELVRIRWLADDALLALEFDDGRTQLWETQRWQLFRQILNGAVNRDATVVASVVSGDEIQLVGVASGAALGGFDAALAGGVFELSWSPDGDALVLSGQRLAVWDIDLERR